MASTGDHPNGGQLQTVSRDAVSKVQHQPGLPDGADQAHRQDAGAEPGAGDRQGAGTVGQGAGGLHLAGGDAGTVAGAVSGQPAKTEEEKEALTYSFTPTAIRDHNRRVNNLIARVEILRGVASRRMDSVDDELLDAADDDALCAIAKEQRAVWMYAGIIEDLQSLQVLPSWGQIAPVMRRNGGAQ